MKLLDLLTSPWAIRPDKLQEIQAVYRAHIRGEKIDVKGIEAKVSKYVSDIDNERGYTIQNGIAVITIDGIITKRRSLFGFFFGASSSLYIKQAYQAANNDPAVKAILLAIDSPGGTVDGAQELAGYIYDNKKKPVYAYSDGILASAAYWIGAAADKIYISSGTVEVGSIGVVATHIDQSKFDEMMGDKYTEITAGKYKRIASVHAPLTEEGQSYLQGQVDTLYAVMIEDIARLRGRTVDQVLAMADGKIFIGQQAVDVGLVDGVATIEATVEKLKGETKMEYAEFKQKYPALYQAAVDEGVTQGRSDGMAQGAKEGAESERKRIVEMEAMLIPGNEALLASCKADASCTPADFAVKQSLAEKKQREDALAKMIDGAIKPLAHAAAPEPGQEERTPEGFMAAVEKEMKTRGIGRGAAVKLVASEHPELHQAYIAGLQKANKEG